jgi:hypothetical protein
MLKEDWMSKHANVKYEGGSDDSGNLIVVIVLIIAAIIILITTPWKPPKSHLVLTDKMETVETFFTEVQALSISMPLIDNETIILISDSLLVALVDLNHTWMNFVATNEDFNKYTVKMQVLNEKVEKIRIKYEAVKTLRRLEGQRNELNRVKKKKTIVQNL